MYLCLGVFMNLLSKEVFGKPNYATQENIFETIHNRFGNFEYALPSPTTISKYFSCTREINDIVINEIKRLKTTDSSLLFDNLKAIAIDLQNNIISAFKQKDLVSVIIYIIEHDDEISASTVIGKSGYYTRNELLHAKEIDLTEFLENILYFIFDERKNNDLRGNQTIKWIREKKNFTDIVSHSTINLITYNPGNKQATTLYLDNSSSNVMSNIFPHKLTDYTVVGASENTVLYRETEYTEITDSFRSGCNSILLSGMGGRGKTSIARLVYTSTKSNYDYYGWINYSDNLDRSLVNSIKFNNCSEEGTTKNEFEIKLSKIEEFLCDKNISKLIILDNVDYIDKKQNPPTDLSLLKMSNWRNTKILLTSRLPIIPGCEKTILISNLGNSANNEKCVELFYHYNVNAKSHGNEAVVKQLCELASYNTMVIELLAKSSLYNYSDLNDFYNNLCKIGFHYTDEIPVTTDHDYTANDIEPNENMQQFETAASQLIKLFNLKRRSEVEQQIIWEFHCLPENSQITPKELSNILGFSMVDIIQLEKEGWITFKDGYFSIHPLIQKAIDTSTFFNSSNDNSWVKYWEKGKKIRKAKGNHLDLFSNLYQSKLELSSLQSIENDDIFFMINKLTLSGLILDNITLFNLGYGMLYSGHKTFADSYLSKLYERIVKSKIDVNYSTDCEFFSKVLTLRYIIETNYFVIIDSRFLHKQNDTRLLSLDNIITNAIVLLFSQQNTITKLEDSINIMILHFVISDYILSFCYNDNCNDKPIKNAFEYIFKVNPTKEKIYYNGKLAFSLPDTITIKSKVAICLSFLKYIERTIQLNIDKYNYNTKYLEFYALTMYNLGRFYSGLNLSKLIKSDIYYTDPILEFGYDNFHISLSWNDIFYAYKHSDMYYETAIYYQLKAISLDFPHVNDNSFQMLIKMCYYFSTLLNNIPSLCKKAYIFKPNNTLLSLCRSTKNAILWIADFTNKYGFYLSEENILHEYSIFYLNLSLRCYRFILENNYVSQDIIRKEIEDIENEIRNIKERQ